MKHIINIAILIGIFSYVIFAFGILGILYKNYILLLGLLFIFIYLYKNRTDLSTKIEIRKIKCKNKLLLFAIIIFALQVIVALIGVLGPEISFDALWYHLTLPKIYLQNHSIFHIPGGLLYYSDMPKLGEMLYIFGLSLGSELFPKMIHFAFGILTCYVIYKISRKFANKTLSFIVVIVFYANLVVGWESITAYIDLIRAFFEILALYLFIDWWEEKKIFWLIESAVVLGLAISTKLLGVSSIIIFIFLIVVRGIQLKQYNKTLIWVILYLFFSLIIILPWIAFSYVNTGNPIYPFFTNTYKVTVNFALINPINFIAEVWNLFTNSSDPVLPLYLILMPFFILMLFKSDNKKRIIFIYVIVSLFIWYFTPRTGGGRFILSYLPAFSVAVVLVISEYKKIKSVILYLIIFLSIISVIYRGVANAKFIPVILGFQTKSDFLSKHLNFNFGDFYDTDNYFKNHIEQSDTVLLYGFHNLFYINFPFIHESWVKAGDRFNYIAVQNGKLPERFSYWKLIYYNQKTNVRLYSLGGQEWVY
ncbi:MAG: glycosyltransferase family 39 protein [Patescibacteria group bacterium]|nr:glycosyltransferase family 39 protein [Patescibacteria group bacterium]